MGEVTLKVAAEHSKAFKLAALAEIGKDAEWVTSAQEETARSLGDEYRRGHELADVRASARSLGQVIAITEQLFAAPDGEAVDVRGDASQLAHTAETMARDIITPQLKDETIEGPFDTEAVENISALTSALGWATGEAARLHAVATAQLRAARAVDPRAVAH
ncbi:MAG: hypothetical protein AABM42_01930 [Actinomycetota bacterium]